MNNILLTAMMTAGFCLSPSFGIEIPVGDVSKPIPPVVKPQVNKANIQKVDEKAKPRKGAWLGVAGDPITEILAQHLEIDKGLVINVVVPQSPAKQIGLQRMDVITKVGDIKVGTQEDLRKAISFTTPGQKVELQFLRKGKIYNQDVNMGSRPDRSSVNQLNLSLNSNLKAKPGGEGLSLKADFLNASEMDKEMQSLLKQMPGVFLRSENGGIQMRSFKEFNINLGSNGLKSGSKIMISDNQGSISVSENEDGNYLKAVDVHGELLFEGPMNTEEERAMIPAGVLERVNQLQKYRKSHSKGLNK